MARSASAPTTTAPLRGEQTVGAGRVRGDEVDHALEREASPQSLGQHERVDEGGAAEAGQGLPEVSLLVLLRAAGVVGADPVDLAAQHAAPQGVHVGLGPDGRVDLAALVVVRLVGEREVVERGLEPRVEGRVLALELERRRRAPPRSRGAAGSPGTACAPRARRPRRRRGARSASGGTRCKPRGRSRTPSSCTRSLKTRISSGCSQWIESETREPSSRPACTLATSSMISNRCPRS